MASLFPASVDTFSTPTAGSATSSPSHATLHVNVNNAITNAQTYMGMTLVGSTTAGSGVTTLTLNNVFSATYNAYRVVVSGGTSTGGTVSCITQLIDSGGTPVATGYYEVFIYSTYASSGVSTANGSNIASFLRGVNSIGTGYSMTGVFDLLNPFTAEPTHYYNSVSPIANNGGLSMGYQSTASSYTGLKLTTTGTMTNTKLAVYGYRL